MKRMFSVRTFRKRRTVAVLIVFISVLSIQLLSSNKAQAPVPQRLDQPTVLAEQTTGKPAIDVLGSLTIKGRAPKTGYARSQFGDGWAQVGGCDMRNIMLARYMQDVRLGDDLCIVLSGILDDVYTGKSIAFVRGENTSDEVQIDHVVALSNAWQTGAQQLTEIERERFANDPLNLIPVDGDANQQKGDSDAASWLPPNKSFRCQYISRQISVKSKYNLWVTEAEQAAMKRVLNGCGDIGVPVER